MNPSQTAPAPGAAPVRGYLHEDFRLFHLKDLGKGPYEYHYHDFLKIMILIEGKVRYTIEGRSYDLAPWDIVLVDRGLIRIPGFPPNVSCFTCPLFFSPLQRGRKTTSPSVFAPPSTATPRHSVFMKRSGFPSSPLSISWSRPKQPKRRPLPPLFCRACSVWNFLSI